MALFRKQNTPPKPLIKPEFDVLITLLKDANKYVTAGHKSVGVSILRITKKDIELIIAKLEA